MVISYILYSLYSIPGFHFDIQLKFKVGAGTNQQTMHLKQRKTIANLLPLLLRLLAGRRFFLLGIPTFKKPSINCEFVPSFLGRKHHLSLLTVTKQNTEGKLAKPKHFTHEFSNLNCTTKHTTYFYCSGSSFKTHCILFKKIYIKVQISTENPFAVFLL